MRRFQFSLDPVLRLRRRLVEQAQIELAEQQRRLGRAQAEEAQTRAALQEAQRQCAALQCQTVDIRRLAAADQHADTLAHALLLRQEQVRQAAVVVEISRQELHQRRVERESLERLRERRLAAHRQEEQRIEQQALDEAAVFRWGRE